MDALPLYATELVAQLDKMYPLKNPRKDETLAETQRRAGQRDVVEHLLILLNRDKEEAIHNQ